VSDAPNTLPEVDAIADALAAFMLAEHQAGRSLTARALVERAAARFVGCSALIAATRRDLALHAELAWPHWTEAQLAARVRARPEFQSLALHREMIGSEIEDITAMLDEAPSDSEDADDRRRSDLQARRERLRADLPRLRTDAVAPPAPPIESAIATLADLARMLEISQDELDTALRFTRSRQAFRLLVMRKQSGGLRIIEQPQDALRVLQRRVLREVLVAADLHPAAHGFVRGRSALMHAALHAGRRLVFRLDIADFFTSITAGRVHSAYLRLGVPPRVATVLTSLSTSLQGAGALRGALRRHDPFASQSGIEAQARDWQQTLCVPHLPQGAPTSPALANWIAYRLDQRLTGLAAVWDMRYSRYADDLTFSTDAADCHGARFVDQIRAVVASEGWVLNERKTLVMPQASRQRVTGIVVNRSLNLCRRDYDALKAALHRHVTAAQDDGLKPQLLGRIAWLAQFRPERADRLRQKLRSAQR
jgi:RNA-directed DNA polymerase